MVNVENASRKEIARALKIIDSLNPNLIAVNLQFSSNKDYKSDSALVDALWGINSLVMASVIKFQNDEYSFTYGSMPEFVPFQAKTGFANVFLEDDRQLKMFSVYEEVEGKNELSFAVQIAMKFDSLRTSQFIERNPKKVTVSYVSKFHIFKKMSINDVLNLKISGETIKDKIVLIGYIGPEEKDKFITPLNTQRWLKKPDMYGLEYIANVILQILTTER